MPTTTVLNRQQDLDNLITQALKDPDLLEALQAFQMGQHEYARAIAGTTNIKIVSTDTSNLKSESNAILEQN
ncbi:hypothetical protein KKA69_06760 [Patescibacteria group bacterium]|nr:hypothetical protein [Patescibacteria group bacterium]